MAAKMKKYSDYMLDTLRWPTIDNDQKSKKIIGHLRIYYIYSWKGILYGGFYRVNFYIFFVYFHIFLQQLCLESYYKFSYELL